MMTTMEVARVWTMLGDDSESNDDKGNNIMKTNNQRHRGNDDGKGEDETMACGKGDGEMQ